MTKTKSRYWSHQEKLDLLDKLKASNSRVYLIVRMLFETGARVGELGDIMKKVESKGGIEGAEFEFKPSKNSNLRTLKITKTMREYFSNFKPMLTGAIKQSINRAVKEIGVDFSPHDARKTWATNLSRNGVSIQLIKAMGG